MDEKRTQPLNPCAEPHLPRSWHCDSCRKTVSGQHLCPGPDVPTQGLEELKSAVYAGKSSPADIDPTDPPPNENSPDPEAELLAQDPKTNSPHPWHRKPHHIEDLPEDRHAAPDLFDETNIRSVVNLLPPKMKLRALSIPLELRDKTPSQLQKLCNQRWTGITHTLLDKLRIGFWLEYTRVQEGNLPVMKLNNIFDGLCSAATFTNLEPLKLAYVMTPPTDYVISMETILHKTTAMLESALEFSPVQKICRCHYFCQCKTAQRKKAHKCACKSARGCKCPAHVDAKLLGTLLEIHKTVEQRLKGAVVQRVKTENKNLNVNMDMSGRPADHPELTEEELNRKIAELRAKEKNRPLALPMAQAQVDLVPQATEILEGELVK